MHAVVPTTRDEVEASLVAADSWTRTTGCPATIVVDHPDLVSPVSGLAGRSHVLSWAQTGTEPGDDGAATAAAVGGLAPGTTAVLLPASALVLAAPTSLAEASSACVAAAATNASADRPADGRRPSAEDLGSRGRWHAGLVGLGAGDPAAVPYLVGLHRTGRDALRAPTPEPATIVGDPGLGVAWWNLHERPLGWEERTLTAAGVPVSVVDFDGWDPAHEHMPHPDMTRLLASGDPALRRLLACYADRRRAAAARLKGVELSTWPTDPVLRDLMAARTGDERRAALRDDPGAREEFLAWAGSTDHEDTVWGLNRYLVGLRRGRYDLQSAFPDINDRTDVTAFLAWARGTEDGAPRVPERYAGPVPVVDPSPDRDPAAPEDVGSAHHDELEGVNLIGMFDEAGLGIAEIARQVLSGIRASGLEVRPVTVDRRGRPVASEDTGPLPYRLTVACVNGDLMPVVRHRLRHRVRADMLHVGVWWWELEEVPASWDPAFGLVDEVWAGTRFVADAFSGRFPGTVRVVPLGLGALGPVGRLPAIVGTDERPYVLVTFDYASRVERKNPVAAIEAFAGADLGPGLRLVVKSVNGDVWPREAERVRLAALDAAEADIVLLDERLPADEQAALVAGASAHLALHRSEGLGLTIVESMLRGVPVVATDYGGSTDVLDATTGWPIAWTPGRVPPHCAPYPEGSRWAEPDVVDASHALREVLAGGPDVAARVAGARAAARLRADRLADGRDVAAAAAAALEPLRTERARQTGVRGRMRDLRSRVSRSPTP